MTLCPSGHVQKDIWCALFILVETQRVGRAFNRISSFYGVFLWNPQRTSNIIGVSFRRLPDSPDGDGCASSSGP